LLDSTPVRSITGLAAGAPGSAIISGPHEFNANLFEFRLGPGVEIPLSRKLAVSLSGGFALVYVDSEFSFNETVTIPGVGSVANHGSGWGNAWLPSAYVAPIYLWRFPKSGSWLQARSLRMSANTPRT
jgi:hypothetical protein